LVGDFLCSFNGISAAPWGIADRHYRLAQRCNIVSGACLIGVNWYIFIWSIQVEKATEASLGYFIFSLAVVAMGWIGFGERLSRLQNIAIALAVAAVILMTVFKGLFPWIALVIALSFSLYGFVKKTILTGPVVSVTAEVLLLVPLAVAVLYFVHREGAGSFFE
jgi:chloramphenicol-sensitive protein RarD